MNCHLVMPGPGGGTVTHPDLSSLCLLNPSPRSLLLFKSALNCNQLPHIDKSHIKADKYRTSICLSPVMGRP